MNMKKPILDVSNSSDDTDSTQTQCSVVLPPIRNSNTFDSLVEKNRLNHSAANDTADVAAAATAAAIAAAVATGQDHQLNSETTFRKCQSFIHLSKASDKFQSSLIDSSGNCDRLRKATSTPTAIYMAIKQEHHLYVHRIFNRCKVNLICCFAFV